MPGSGTHDAGGRGAGVLPDVAWHISSRSSGAGAECVEAGPVRDGSGRIAVRHSHRPEGEVLFYTRAEWDAFLAGVKSGEFDFR
ncbi:DUF397 domain-containing protein [Rhizomonospora bruguierae]|uniref:DUF397 domain-containing protein n=1 Tax=Rhizomonospora bruguierae TaxID=1581705 RepID=UPI001BCC4F2C|nr:DUF397 domain-containing protein [Micromonospora sp. NBRC 107566]